MSSIVRSISLDPKTANIAQRIPNFSKFCRECLLRWDSIQRSPDCPVEKLEHPLVGDHCIPAPTRICLKHWPNGNPRLEDWREFRHIIEFDEFHKDRDRLLRAWPFLDDFNCPEEWIQHRGNAKPTKRDRDASRAQKMWGGRLKFWKK